MVQMDICMISLNVERCSHIEFIAWMSKSSNAISNMDISVLGSTVLIYRRTIVYHISKTNKAIKNFIWPQTMSTNRHQMLDSKMEKKQEHFSFKNINSKSIALPFRKILIRIQREIVYKTTHKKKYRSLHMV